jgi:hypothetical protein
LSNPTLKAKRRFFAGHLEIAHQEASSTAGHLETAQQKIATPDVIADRSSEIRGFIFISKTSG